MKFTHENLIKVCKQLKYTLPKNGKVLLGIRGAIPDKKYKHVTFNQTQAVTLKKPDYLNMSCTIGIWDLDNKKIAIFWGSTVPHQSNVAYAKLRNGQGTNQMMEGFYQDLYIKGVHYPRVETAHQALVQNKPVRIQRTIDDLDYDIDDRIDYSIPYDNLHAGWTQDGKGYASAGCQVIHGYPKCQKIANNSGEWKLFYDLIYSTPQKVFSYLLIDAKTLEKEINK